MGVLVCTYTTPSVTHFSFLSKLTNCLLEVALGYNSGPGSGYHPKDPQRKTKQEGTQVLLCFLLRGLKLEMLPRA